MKSLGDGPRTLTQFGNISRGLCPDVMKSPPRIRLTLCRRILQGYAFPYLKNPGSIRLSLFRQEDPEDHGGYSPRYSLPPP
ncbi:hypothetical protein F511_37674 [Dorcoceras hygrometricum]|uniref:Uncharacterized protein n=1 Tax=Dorcoceras hygrometricum TaxID=472368 RepID=A0A2Z7AIQ7_9LAMI|nr:hypothetical protein F511_37674 [Dorcoceras hygrometricum]